MSECNEKLEILLEEYKSLREEILSDNNASFTNTTTALAALTAILAVLFATANTNKPTWVLLTPLVFYVINLYQLRLAVMTNNISRYLVEDLSPRIKRYMKENNDGFIPFAWEEYARQPEFSNKFVFMFVEASRYGLPLFLALLMIVFYYILIKSNGDFKFELVDWIVSGINIIGLFVSGWIILVVRRHIRKIETKSDTQSE